MSTTNYQESPVTGTQWLRAYGVQIANPLDGLGRISFAEELVTSLPDRTIREHNATLMDDYVPGRDIVLLDPTTGQPTGQTVPEALVYQALYSKYIALAVARDEAQAA